MSREQIICDGIAYQIDLLARKYIEKPFEFTKQDRSELETLCFQYSIIARPILKRILEKQWLSEHTMWYGFIDYGMVRVVKLNSGAYQIWQYDGQEIVNKISIAMHYIMTPTIKWEALCKQLIQGDEDVLRFRFCKIKGI